jgi:hypothetical protein
VGGSVGANVGGRDVAVTGINVLVGGMFVAVGGSWVAVGGNVVAVAAVVEVGAVVDVACVVFVGAVVGGLVSVGETRVGTFVGDVDVGTATGVGVLTHALTKRNARK